MIRFYQFSTGFEGEKLEKPHFIQVFHKNPNKTVENNYIFIFFSAIAKRPRQSHGGRFILLRSTISRPPARTQRVRAVNLIP